MWHRRVSCGRSRCVRLCIKTASFCPEEEKEHLQHLADSRSTPSTESVNLSTSSRWDGTPLLQSLPSILFHVVLIIIMKYFYFYLKSKNDKQDIKYFVVFHRTCYRIKFDLSQRGNFEAKEKSWWTFVPTRCLATASVAVNGKWLSINRSTRPLGEWLCGSTSSQSLPQHIFTSFIPRVYLRSNWLPAFALAIQAC